MAIRIVCPICSKRQKIADRHAGGLGECRKCGAPVRVPWRIEDLARSKDARMAAEPATTIPGRHLSAARWNKWSLAAAREFWVGHRLACARERAAGLEGPVAARPRARSPLGLALLTLGTVTLAASVAVVTAILVFGQAATASAVTGLAEPTLVVVIGAVALGALGLGGVGVLLVRVSGT